MHYMKKINSALALGAIDQGSINHCIVEHEDNCNSHDGGECDCDSTVLLKTKQGWVEILDGGTLLPIGEED